MHATQISLTPDRPGFQAFRSVEPGRSAKRMACEQAGIVHDLGNLIQVVSSALNIISREVTYGHAQKLNPVFAAARSSLERASILVRRSLGAARDQAAPVEPVEIGECLAGLAPTINAMRGTGIVVTFSVQPDLPPLTCNRVDLENAILNLALNARDAMPQGGALLITAGALAGPAGVDHLLRVTDTGCGMAPEVLARVFEPFYTTKQDRGGSGVGLATVVRFADSAGARLAIESAVGLGTTVNLLFPQSPQPPCSSLETSPMS